jgi:hypothetical protein
MVGQRVKATTVYHFGIQLEFSHAFGSQNHHICLIFFAETSHLSYITAQEAKNIKVKIVFGII